MFLHASIIVTRPVTSLENFVPDCQNFHKAVIIRQNIYFRKLKIPFLCPKQMSHSSAEIIVLFNKFCPRHIQLAANWVNNERRAMDIDT